MKGDRGPNLCFIGDPEWLCKEINFKWDDLVGIKEFKESEKGSKNIGLTKGEVPYWCMDCQNGVFVVFDLTLRQHYKGNKKDGFNGRKEYVAANMQRMDGLEWGCWKMVTGRDMWVPEYVYITIDTHNTIYNVYIVIGKIIYVVDQKL